MKTYICKEDLIQRLTDEAEKAEHRALKLDIRGELHSHRAAIAEVDAYRKAAAIVADTTEMQL